MITFICTACEKKLSVKDELAGKKGKCPGCGQAVAVPGAARPVDATDAVTVPPPDHSDPTREVNAGDAGSRGELTDFLSPPQSADELGRLGKYRVLQVLGHGGMGVVFRAEDTKLKRSVALKAMLPAMAASPSAGKRFLREAQAMAAVEHDHVVRVYEGEEERGVPYLAMEFLKGEPLDARLERDGQLPLAEALRVGREMAEGLSAAHERGLIHRDIKPANVWLEAPKGRVKILDFGLARAMVEESNLTQQGAIMGTPAYMSPEQARGETVDSRCDLFSLGVVLYKMLTGSQPFKGRDPISTLMEVATHHPPSPRELRPVVPKAVSALVMRLLEKDPTGRPASADEVAETMATLEKKLSAEPPDDSPTQVVEEAAPHRRDKGKKVGPPWPLIGAGVGLLVLVPLIWWAVTVLRVETPTGTLVVVIDDKDMEARIKGGKLVLTDADGKVKYTLSASERNKAIDAGAYKIHVEGADGLTLDTEEFTIRKGDKVTVRVTVVRTKVVKKEGPGEGWVPLFNGKDLDGWVNDGDSRVEDFKADADGISVTGGEFNTWGFLLSNKDYTDFVLRMQFQQKVEGAISGIALRGVPGGMRVAKDNLAYQVKVNLHNDARSGAVLWAPGSTLKLPDKPAKLKPAGEWNDIQVEMRGQRVRVSINGEQVQDMDLAEFAARPGAFAALKRASGRVGLQKQRGDVKFRNIFIKELPREAADAGFVPLFNGKDLTGWSSMADKGGRGNWKVVAGAITCTGQMDHLRSDVADLGDFHLRARVKINEEGNSGIFFRAGDPLKLVGDYEAQISNVAGQQKTGSLQSLVKVSRILVKADTWFDYEIMARGSRIRLWVNGEETADYKEERAGSRESGHIYLQHHNPKTSVHFRKIEVKRLPRE